MSSYSRFIRNDPDTLSKLDPVNPRAHLLESLNIIVSDYPPSTAAQSPARGLLSGPTSVAYLFLWLSKLYSCTSGRSNSTTSTNTAQESGNSGINNYSVGSGAISSSSSTATLTALAFPASELIIDDRSPRDWCLSYLRASRSSIARQKHGGRAGGIQDEAMAYACVKAAVTGDPAYVERALRLASKQLHQSDSTGSASSPSLSSSTLSPAEDVNQWLYGRAGTLYLLRSLACWVPLAKARIDPLVHDLTEHIISFDEPWAWKGKQYLGAAHGDAGILAQLILSRPELGSRLEERVQGLLKEQLPSGQWESSRRYRRQRSSNNNNNGNDNDMPSTPGRPHDELVQFCHGAPGIAIALAAMRPHMKSSDDGGGAGESSATQRAIDGALAGARDVVWQHGLLTKEPGLCHGISGNALAFEAHDPRRELLLRMATPHQVATGVLSTAVFSPSSDAYGLLWGEAGRAWVWAVMDGRAHGFVGFSDV